MSHFLQGVISFLKVKMENMMLFINNYFSFIYNYFSDTREAESHSNSSRREKKSAIEWISVIFPFMLYSNFGMYNNLYSLDLNLPVLLISSFPASLQNVVTIKFCLVIETILITLYMTWAAYFVFVVLSFSLTSIQWSRLEVKKVMDG